MAEAFKSGSEAAPDGVSAPPAPAAPTPPAE